MSGIDMDTLGDLYINRRLSTKDIARAVKHSRWLVEKMLRVYGMPLRSRSESMMLRGHGTAWKGGRYKSHGYVYVYAPDHPDCNSKGYILEHRLVMGEKLGRRLLPSEQPHHINGIRDDNRPENIELATVDGHTMLTMYCKNCALRKRVETLEQRVKHLNLLLYGTEKPSTRDFLRIGYES